MKTFESEWADAQGLKFYSKGWEPDGKPKATVALVHGLGEHIGRFAYVGEAFSNAGYALMGFDLRGHGRSEGQRGHTPSFEAYMRDIDLLLEHVHAHFPGLPTFLYGHSMGGILVLAYTLQRKPKLVGVIASSPGLHNALEQQTVKLLTTRILGSLVPTMSLSSGLNTSVLSHDPEIERAYRSDPLVHDRVTVGWGKAMLAATRWTLAHAAEFPLPLLLVQGTADTIAFPSSSEEYAAALDERATLVLWKDLYHETHNELNKREVLQTTIRWMDGRLKAA